MDQRQIYEALEDVEKLRNKVNSLEQENRRLEQTLENVTGDIKAAYEIIGTLKNKIEWLEREQVKSNLRITMNASLDPATRQNAENELGKILEREARLAELDRPAVRPQENNEDPELSTFIK